MTLSSLPSNAGGLIAVAALSMASGWLLVRAFGQFRGAAGVAWRYGLANISRRGTESIVQIVAFALSLMVLLLLTLVRTATVRETTRPTETTASIHTGGRCFPTMRCRKPR